MGEQLVMAAAWSWYCISTGEVDTSLVANSTVSNSFLRPLFQLLELANMCNRYRFKQLVLGRSFVGRMTRFMLLLRLINLLGSLSVGIVISGNSHWFAPFHIFRWLVDASCVVNFASCATGTQATSRWDNEREADFLNGNSESVWLVSLMIHRRYLRKASSNLKPQARSHTRMRESALCSSSSKASWNLGYSSEIEIEASEGFIKSP